MANPVRKLERTRRDARRFAAEARKLATGGRPRLDGKIRDAVMTACDAVDAAAAEGDATRLSAALRALDALWGEHLERLGKAPWRTYVEVVAAAVIAALLVRAGVVAGEPIASGAMVPTLLPGDRVLVSRLAYGVALPFTGRRLWGAPPRRGDVVALEGAGAPGVGRVARVVGIPGDVIAVRGEVLYVNGVPQPRAPDGEQPYGEAGDRLRRVCRRFREALARGPMTPATAATRGCSRHAGRRRRCRASRRTASCSAAPPASPRRSGRPRSCARGSCS